MNNIKKFEELNENVTDVFTLVKGILKSEFSKNLHDIEKTFITRSGELNNTEIESLAKKIVNKLTKGGYLRK